LNGDLDIAALFDVTRLFIDPGMLGPMNGALASGVFYRATDLKRVLRIVTGSSKGNNVAVNLAAAT